ncbi:esterase-like activity of phytase family protein [Fictibacillus enclensis]|uniref:esterase-like activity of phytase family protein n=1 Tax=Fictibacillus enclensis TaxID=1017270 RepID=UPI0024C081B3|nr:esterase-like activity of phytase family protein [Fictibacillus enclensis]WHY74558.1 esterase-like activity of phytase family protein [Fictibacillus enclensis]
MLKKWKQMKSKKPILRLAAGAVALSGLLATPSFAETPKSTSYKIIKSTKVSNAVPSIDKEAEMVKLYVQNAWNARMFQLYDKIPIGKSVDDEIKSVPSIHTGDELYLGGFSGLVHLPKDPENVFYTITDRGPNGDSKYGKFFPVPAFSPQIVKIELGNGAVHVLKQIPLKLPKGYTDPITNSRNISGISNFPGENTTKLAGFGTMDEISYGAAGQVLPADPYGLDTEAISYNPNDDTFWVSEEYRPSLVQVKRDGTIIQRLVPKGEKDLFASSPVVPVHDTLPAVFAMRNPNKGLEGTTVTPNGRYLYTALQGPIINPYSDGSAPPKGSTAIRVLRYDLKHMDKDPKEFLYVLDGKHLISDITAVDNDHVLFDERDSDYSYKSIFKVDFSTAANPTNIFGLLDGESLDKTDVTLENTVTTPYAPDKTYTVTPTGGTTVTVKPLQKTLFVDAKERGYNNSKLEGIAMPNDHTLALANDNDFGVQDPDPEQVWLYNLTGTAQEHKPFSKPSKAGKVYVTRSANNQDITITDVLGEKSLLGTVTFVLPEGVKAAPGDAVIYGNRDPIPLTASQLSDTAGGGQFITVDGVCLHKGESVKLLLKGKSVSPQTFSPKVYVDSDGPENEKGLSAGFTIHSQQPKGSKMND